jgi:hypothetical protein
MRGRIVVYIAGHEARAENEAPRGRKYAACAYHFTVHGKEDGFLGTVYGKTLDGVIRRAQLKCSDVPDKVRRSKGILPEFGPLYQRGYETITSAEYVDARCALQKIQHETFQKEFEALLKRPAPEEPAPRADAAPQAEALNAHEKKLPKLRNPPNPLTALRIAPRTWVVVYIARRASRTTRKRPNNTAYAACLYRRAPEAEGFLSTCYGATLAELIWRAQQKLWDEPEQVRSAFEIPEVIQLYQQRYKHLTMTEQAEARYFFRQSEMLMKRHPLPIKDEPAKAQDQA